MGNRAIITTKNGNMGLYLHWNGGRDSVTAFLKYCEIQGFRSPDADSSYGWARLAQVVANFFPVGLSVGVGNYSEDAGLGCDHGTFIIEGWQIVGRKHMTQEEQAEYELLEFLLELDKRQPEAMRLGEKRIRFCCAEHTLREFAAHAEQEMFKNRRFFTWRTPAKREIGSLVLDKLPAHATFNAADIRTQLEAAAEAVGQMYSSKTRILALLDYVDIAEKEEEYLALPLEALQNRLTRRATQAAIDLAAIASEYARGEHLAE